MKKTRDEDVQITPEEREMLRRLMETPGIEREWEFFDQKNTDKSFPPPEYFMRGEPKRPQRRWIWYVVGGMVAVGTIIICLNR